MNYKGLKYTTSEGNMFEYLPCSIKAGREVVRQLKRIRPKNIGVCEAGRLHHEHPERFLVRLPNGELKPIAFCEIKTGQNYDFILSADRNKYKKYVVPKQIKYAERGR